MMNKPIHENSGLANSSSYWAPFDTQQKWEINMRDTSTRKLLTKLGYDNPDAITYTYNSHGFRDQEFDNRSCGIAFGCSFTHGTGLAESDTWPRKLSKILGLHIWNLGIGGASLDTVYRLSEYYIDLLQPKFVMVLTPPGTRFEYFSHNRYQIATIHDDHDQEFFKHWFANEQNFLNHQQKNLQAIENISKSRNAQFVSLCPLNDWTQKNTRARDLAHPDIESNQHLADQFAKLLKT